MKETTTRIIINQFIEKKALAFDKAIDVSDIEVGIKDLEKNFFINNLITSRYLVETNDEKLWFNQELWNKSIRKLTIQYSFIMAIPMVIAFILYFIFFI